MLLRIILIVGLCLYILILFILFLDEVWVRDKLLKSSLITARYGPLENHSPMYLISTVILKFAFHRDSQSEDSTDVCV